MKQPILEKIKPGFGSSFTVRKFTESQEYNYSTWHFHPEYELVYISSGNGKRHIGNHVSNYQEGDLIFMGPDLPHLCFTDGLKEEHVEVVVQMKPDFLGSTFFEIPEMLAIKRLFDRACQGLIFFGTTKEIIGQKVVDLASMEGMERLLAMLSILQDLSQSEEYKLLNANTLSLEVSSSERDRIAIVYQFIQDEFQNEIVLSEVAAKVNMTVPAFCRYFKKLTNKPFIRFVNEYRIAHACKMLSNESMSITEVCFESGFNNLSHFNKKFKLYIKESPTSYRKKLNKIVL